MYAYLKLLFFIPLSAFFLSDNALQAQPNRAKTSSEILADLKKLNILGNVLYLAAHPDDENTRLITYFSKERLFNTSYLSLTRGDGGQNLIGTEQGDLLGVIRTQELLQARKIDGGIQFFSTARDFGFSKNPEETFRVWDKEQVLSEVVWMIRTLKPDVIITRFSPEPGTTHGHHTASAILAAEAFEAAADKNRFPEQLKYRDTWQAKRIVWNSGKWFYPSENSLAEKKPLILDAGTYNPLLGKSYTEIAAESRSMHKSQGFGTSGTRGPAVEYFEHLKGQKAEKELFEDINTGWTRIKGGDHIEALFQKTIDSFDPSDPSKSVPQLLNAYREIQNIEDVFWKNTKSEEIRQCILDCLGLYIEVSAADYSLQPGEKIKYNLEAINRSQRNVVLDRFEIQPMGTDTTFDTALTSQGLLYKGSFQVPEEMEYGQPYWLTKEGTPGMFHPSEMIETGRAENAPPFLARLSLKIEGVVLNYTFPLVFKKADPVEGEIYRPVRVAPPVFLNLPEKIFLFPGNAPRLIPVIIRAGKDSIAGKVTIQLPDGWRADPAAVNFYLKKKGNEQQVFFKIFPSEKPGEGKIQLIAETGNKKYMLGIHSIEYRHIPAQTIYPEANVKVVRLDIKKKGNRVAYIMGAGDLVPSSLSQIGYDVTVLKESQITLAHLKTYDAVVTGIRAYNTNEKMKIHQPVLMQYVAEGGTLIVQYNNAGGLMVDSIAPYPLKLSTERITVENAPVTMLNVKHPLLNKPNKISAADFNGWVQERGLYFPSQWGKEFEPVLSSSDPGEPAKAGGLLVARYGKGYYIYTSYSWFRQLPAGVPGALRLFVNIISIGK
jgi:LmbE family N-acetylglucosaminyl deacetylase